MNSSGINLFLVGVGRTVAGFVTAVLLAFMGDVAARVLNIMVGFSFPPAVHQNAYFVGIGLGAGIGAFMAWLHVTLPRPLILASLLLVLAGGIAGAYIGRVFGPGVDPTYWWSRFATDRTVYLAAAGLGVFVSTLIGVFTQTFIEPRSRPRFTPSQPTGSAPRAHSGSAR